MAEVVIPAAGIAMEEALVVKWLKEPGDPVEVDDVIAEIETDKATMDILSPAAGTLGDHLFEPGSIVPVGAVIVHVLVEGEAAPGPPVTSAPLPASIEADETVEAVVEASAPEGTARTPHALSPRARRLAAAREEQPAEPAPSADGRFRDLIAAKVTESWREIPHFTVSREIDAEPMQLLLADLRAAATDPMPTFTDLLLRSLAAALRETETGSGRIDVGLAVATPHGVVVPVVRDVLEQGISELASSRLAAVERARSGKLSQDDLSAAPSSTLSNLGSFGVDRFTGIVAVGQTSLLTVGRTRPRVVADENRAMSVRSTFDATLNADHRTVDGAEAARLLVAFATAAENIASAF